LIRRFTQARWFGLADLACATLSGLGWYAYARPTLGGWPLILALLPWVLRVAAGRFPFQRTSFDIPLAVFLMTAGVGVWAAYDRAAAWDKFWTLVGAVLIFYALAAQPKDNLWLAVSALSLIGVLIASYFLLTHDWQSEPADLALINRLALRWMSVRPTVTARYLHPNIAGGLLALLAPLTAALGLNAWRERRAVSGAWALVTGGVMLVGLLFTSSRAAWLALAVAMLAWGLWGASGFLTRLLRQRREAIFVVALLALGGPVVGLMVTYPGGLIALADRLPGLASGASRVDVIRAALKLIADFPFTGGGLGAFGGLYSRYIRVIPDYFLNYSHNFFLDVALEQGWGGFLALMAVMAGTVWVLVARGSQTSRLRWALFASLIVVCLHGLVDDALYGIQGTPLLFALTGLAVSAAPDPPQPEARRTNRLVWITAGLGALVGAMLVGVYYRPLLGQWYADLGAVDMARIELAGWPWPDREGHVDVARLTSAEMLLNQSLQLNPENRTARYRLGLVAARRNDYAAVVAQLEPVYRADPDHPGVRKVLGYTYVWLGELDKAVEVLSAVPEAQADMSVYAWWWGTQGRDDLAQQAAVVAARLEAIQRP
jgi:hypothetical protein